MHSLEYEPLLYEPDQDVGGGKIIIHVGEYTSESHTKIMQDHNLHEQENYDICIACHNLLGNNTDGFEKAKEFYRAGFPRHRHASG